eukprot:TRINITY_DN10296_c0_g1_i1.p1 TRINITY_DN10296_c0_g1~~TRINITY_DN10296_c0_g1_i1.p1  ORF type:complete len:197 (+),score=23.91 TRINITY_DN10296_c0_g1_i1:68-658(+)
MEPPVHILCRTCERLILLRDAVGHGITCCLSKKCREAPRGKLAALAITLRDYSQTLHDCPVRQQCVHFASNLKWLEVLRRICVEATTLPDEAFIVCCPEMINQLLPHIFQRGDSEHINSQFCGSDGDVQLATFTKRALELLKLRQSRLAAIAASLPNGVIHGLEMDGFTPRSDTHSLYDTIPFTPDLQGLSDPACL